MPDKPNEEEVEVIDPDIGNVIPSMNVNVPVKKEESEGKLAVNDEALVGLYDNILEKIEADRNEISDVCNQFLEMVINGGDSTTSSKEALVKLLEMKSNQADKMVKVAELKTRVHLKERDTFPRYLAAQQHNTINIGDNNSRRQLMEALTKAQKKKQKEEER
jgi:cellobiose-specific phosphotransferase system component IIA